MRVVVNRLKILFIGGIVLSVILLGLAILFREALLRFIASGALPLSVVIPVSIALFLMFWAFYKSSRAVLRSQAKERELRISQARFSELYKKSPVPYLTIDDENIIKLANLASVRMFGVSEDELIGTSLSDKLTHEQENKLSILLGRLQSRAAINKDEAQLIVGEDEPLWVLISVFSYGLSGERLVAIVDISHQKAVEAAKSEFVSLASHQLRTPISVIQWNLELLGTGDNSFNESQLKYIEKISRNTEQMSVLINDFLNASKLELGTFATKTVALELVPFISAILEEFEVRVERKRQTILTKFEPEAYTMQVDERLMHIIVSNLMSNAVKYTPEDGEVRLSYEVTDDTIVITVADTGMGIPVSEQEQLFKKFYRATNARKEVSEGTGLGLHLVRRAAKMLGGDIAFESEEGKGTTFIVTLPRM